MNDFSMPASSLSAMVLVLLLAILACSLPLAYSRCHVHLDHGFVTHTSTGHGESVLSFGCKPNFLLNGPTSVTCTDGKLSGHVDVRCAAVDFSHDPAVEPPADYDYVSTAHCQDVSSTTNIASCPIGYGPTAAGGICPMQSLPMSRVTRHQLLLNGTMSTVYAMDVQCASGHVNIQPVTAHARCCSFKIEHVEAAHIKPFPHARLAMAMQPAHTLVSSGLIPQYSRTSPHATA